MDAPEPLDTQPLDPQPLDTPDAAAQEGDRARRFGLRAALSAVAILVVAVPFGLLLLLVSDQWAPLVRLDDGARDGLNRVALSSDLFVTAMKAVSLLGTSACYVLVFGAMVVRLLRRGQRRLATYVGVTLTGGGLLNLAVKSVVDRARPVLPDPVAHASYSSFPSGHAQGVVVATGVLLIVLLPVVRAQRRRLVVALAALWVLLMGFSRVALGVHYVTDIAGGYLLGLAWLSACTAAFAAWREPWRARRDQPVS